MTFQAAGVWWRRWRWLRVPIPSSPWRCRLTNPPTPLPLVQAAIPGFGITGSCQTVNANPLFPPSDSARLGYPAGTLVTGFGNLPPWSEEALPGAPNDGIPLNTGSGGCILNNGFPFSYMPVGNIFCARLTFMRMSARSE